jgi:hypothetical protein
MPPESIRIGKPCLTLTRLEEGLYRICAYVNPREQGSVYFKVFDMSKSSYSKDAEPGAPEYIGWSDNPNQLFFCDAYQRIWYGNPNKLFPARIELWFKPDSGKPDRKLYEDYFYTSGCRG